MRKNEERKLFNVYGKDTMLWHQRLAHIGEKVLQSLQGEVIGDTIQIARNNCH